MKALHPEFDPEHPIAKDVAVRDVDIETIAELEARGAKVNA